MAPAASATAAAPANEPLLLRHDDHGIVTLTLNRPQQYNALCDALLGELQSQIDAIAADPAIRVVVIAGAGRAFCAGHDLKEMRARPDQGYYRDLFQRCSRMMLTITQMPQPVIARVHGIATAAGCQLVATCDLAVASSEAQFCTPGVNIGLFCSTPMVALSRNVSRKRAMEMLLLGDMLSAKDAVDYGLINKVVAANQLLP
jgi:enoyl-CoA hydratase/carnithine racemase